MTTDPVCKMSVEPAKAAAQSVYKARRILLRGGLQAEVRPRARQVPGRGLEPDESAPMIEPACCAAATATSA